MSRSARTTITWVAVVQPVGNDTICNGADDDGSGTTALLGMAEALAKAPTRPKRSVLFVWHCGEEKGLWGSRYFTEFPTVPLNQIVAQLNIDMIGRSKKEGDTNTRNKDLTGPDAVYLIGSTLMSTELEMLVNEVNKSFLNLTFDTRYDDPSDPNRFFFRSDHYNYARKGIPIIFFFSGTHEDYHRAGDTADKIDYQKMEKITRTIYMTLWEIANRAQRLKVDKPVPTQICRRIGPDQPDFVRILIFDKLRRVRDLTHAPLSLVRRDGPGRPARIDRRGLRCSHAWFVAPPITLRSIRTTISPRGSSFS